MQLSAWLALFNLTITLIEIAADLALRRRRRWKDSGANVLILVMNSLLERSWYGAVIFVLLLPVYYLLTPFEIPMTPWTWIVALLLADFTYYWMHRLEHKYQILWAHHSVHHSSEDFNLTVAFRLCVFEGAIEWVFFIPMILLGFNPFQAIAAFLLIVQYQAWIHTEHIRSLGWLEGVLNTPSAHRVHHGSNKQYLDRNFGGMLMVWDRMFGTFAVEDDVVVYGLTENINTNNPLLINIHEYRTIYLNVKRCRTLKEKIHVLFRELGTRTKPTADPLK